MRVEGRPGRFETLGTPRAGETSIAGFELTLEGGEPAATSLSEEAAAEVGVGVGVGVDVDVVVVDSFGRVIFKYG